MADQTITAVIKSQHVAEVKAVIEKNHPKPDTYAGTDIEWLQGGFIIDMLRTEVMTERRMNASDPLVRQLQDIDSSDMGVDETVID